MPPIRPQDGRRRVGGYMEPMQTDDTSKVGKPVGERGGMVQRGNLVIIAVSGTIAGVVMLALLLALLLVGHARHRHHSPPAPSVITVAPSVFIAIPIPL